MEAPERSRQEQAREYAAIRRKLHLAELGLDGLVLVAIIASGLGIALRQLGTVDHLGSEAIVAFMGLVLIVGFSLITFPLSIYSGFVLPHRYGISVQSLSSWLVDLLKGLALELLFGLVALEVLYYLLRALPGTWWLAAGILYLLFTVVLTNLAPVLVLPLFFKLTPLDPSALTERLVDRAQRAGAQIQGVYSMALSEKTTAANAALMGMGNTRRIVLGDTLIGRFSPDEIDVVFAHELGHHVHRDIPKMLLFHSLLTVAGLWIAAQGLLAGVGALGYNGIADPATLPYLLLLLALFGLVTMPISNAFSRSAERAADNYALRETSNARAFASAMARLADQNLAELDPPRWVTFLFYDHPPIRERIRAAELFAARSSSSGSSAS